MEIIDPKDLLSSPKMFRESDFRERVQQFDWTRFKDKPVLIQGCASLIVPTWAYCVIAAELAPYAKSISYGEVKSPIAVFGKLGNPV